jgi:signal transduction histidine kinase
MTDAAISLEMSESPAEAIRRGDSWRGEVPVRRKDGTVLEAALTLSPMQDKQGTVSAFVANVRDIGPQKEIERMKDAFLATATHELRSPLTAVRTLSDLLLSRDYDETRRKRYLALIQEQSVHLTNIVEKMLDISRLEEGRGLEIEAEPLDLKKIVGEEMDLFRETHPRNEFKMEGFHTLSPVTADPIMLGQVVRNLLSNAVKYSPKDSTIALSASVRDGAVQVSVQDEGVGLTPEQQRHLFEKFYRANEVNVEGAGLGLAICKLIVEKHGGKIWVESKYGRGSTFIFTLPKARGEEPGQAPGGLNRPANL